MRMFIDWRRNILPLHHYWYFFHYFVYCNSLGWCYTVMSCSNIPFITLIPLPKDQWASTLCIPNSFGTIGT